MFGIITGAMRADGRYPVKLYPEDRSVLVRAGNLTMMFGNYDDESTTTTTTHTVTTRTPSPTTVATTISR